MLVLLATIGIHDSIEGLKPILESYGQSLSACPGYVDHFWLHGRDELALVHVFSDRASLRNYSNSSMLSTLAAHPACDGRIYTQQLQLLTDVKRYTLRESTAPAIDSTVATDTDQRLVSEVPSF